SLRIQQILAYETDLLEYEDLFEGSHVVEKQTNDLIASAREELARVLKMGGAVAAVESAYMKQQLVVANTRRLRAIESGERIVVGVNAYTETEPSPLTAGQSILVVDESAEREQIESLRAFRAKRSASEAAAALRELDD